MNGLAVSWGTAGNFVGTVDNPTAGMPFCTPLHGPSGGNEDGVYTAVVVHGGSATLPKDSTVFHGRFVVDFLVLSIPNLAMRAGARTVAACLRQADLHLP